MSVAGLAKKRKLDVASFRARLLGWYDAHQRALPWRALPGKQAKPYHVWLSEIMLQQTTVAAVIPYFLKFLERWPTVQALAVAENADVMAAWAGLGYYARARNLHKCAQEVASQGGIFPDDEAGLKMLPGIGDYTGAAIAAIAFDRPATVVDGNVERVLARWFGVAKPLPAAKKILRAKADLLSQGRSDRPGDFAQGMMDLGATICTPKKPKCMLCPLNADCVARASGRPEDFPVRAQKKAKPQKFGYVYWISNARGEILLERRPEKQMLGGMAGLPTSAWVLRQTMAELAPVPPIPGLRRRKSQPSWRVLHSFTHFDLELRP